MIFFYAWVSISILLLLFGVQEIYKIVRREAKAQEIEAENVRIKKEVEVQKTLREQAEVAKRQARATANVADLTRSLYGTRLSNLIYHLTENANEYPLSPSSINALVGAQRALNDYQENR